MWSRFQAHWGLKLRLTILLNLGFWTVYSVLGRIALFPRRTPPLFWPDLVIPFQPEPWAWIYLSQFLVVGPLAWLIPTRSGLLRFGVGFAALSGISFLTFLFFPVASPRILSAPPFGAMAWIVGYDGILNAFPSLHAGFLVFEGALAWRLFGRRLSVPLRCVGVAWGLAVLYATIATRQHYALDLLAGGVVGAVADWWAWGSSPKARAAATMLQQSDVASQAGSR